jgi:hypothetical protein
MSEEYEAEQEYEIDKDYPAPGKRAPNLIGFVERDEQEGWILYGSFETSPQGEKKSEEKTEAE